MPDPPAAPRGFDDNATEIMSCRSNPFRSLVPVCLGSCHHSCPNLSDIDDAVLSARQGFGLPDRPIAPRAKLLDGFGIVIFRRADLKGELGVFHEQNSRRRRLACGLRLPEDAKRECAESPIRGYLVENADTPYPKSPGLLPKPHISIDSPAFGFYSRCYAIAMTVAGPGAAGGAATRVPYSRHHSRNPLHEFSPRQSLTSAPICGPWARTRRGNKG